MGKSNNIKDMNYNIIKSAHGYYYIYIPNSNSFHFLPVECIPYWTNEKAPDGSRFSDKVIYFKNLLNTKDEKAEICIEYSSLKLEQNLANLNTLLIEVTDGCNLSCKYCGYGELYGNYDKRENKNNTFTNVKSLIDYLNKYWQSDNNFSYNKVCYIGFYGGEPLMNFPLIKETIEYLNTLQTKNKLRFEYNMTTNAMLLDKYMDYIAQNHFHLLISLDGDEFNDSYRVTKNGKASFPMVVRNIHLLQNKYPDYFKQYVNFNAVLHNRNSVKSTISYIKHKFDKIPSISSLSTNGIRRDKHKEFINMFHNPIESYKEAEHCDEFSNWQIQTPDIYKGNYFVSTFCGQTFKSYSDLFVYERDKKYIPTGTCMPLKRKLFLTVNGKLLACERIGHQYQLGEIIGNKVCLDFTQISEFYKRLYGKIIHLCNNCVMHKGCGMCIYHQDKLDKEKINCKAYLPKNKQNQLYAEYLSFFEKKRDAFDYIINKMIVV